MTQGLFHAHSGLRYLILLVGVVALISFALARRSGRPQRPTDRVLMAAFTGLLDLQLLLGIGLVLTGVYYPALIGHMAMMVMAVVIAHAASVMSRDQADVKRGHGLRLAGVAAALLLIAGGVLAIGRGIFSSGAPTM